MLTIKLKVKIDHKSNKKTNKRNPFHIFFKRLGKKRIALIISALLLVLCIFLITQSNNKVSVEMATSSTEVRIEMND